MSTDGGTVWTQKDSYYNDGGCCIVHPDSANVIITGGHGPSTQTNWSFVVSHSRDNGNNWTRCNLSGTASGYCYALAVAPTATEVIYAAGHVTGAGAVYRSSDRGVSWQQTTTAPADTIYGLAVMPGNPNRVIAATLSGAFLTTDAGATWSDLGAGTGFRAIALHPFGPDTLVVAGDFGVEISRDGGQSWTAMNEGLDTLAVTSVGFVEDDGSQLIAGTSGRGCFVWSFSSGTEDEPVKPRQSGLAVLPTFIRDVLLIPRHLTSCPGTRVELLDPSGRRVLDLHPGVNDVSRFSPGVYFVRAAADVRKVLIGR